MKRVPIILATALAFDPAVAGQSPGDWPTVGNDPGSAKYSPLTEITPANVDTLTVAWSYDLGIPANGYTVTPIVVDNVRYLPVGTTIIALTADTGRELWTFDLASIDGLPPNPSAGGRGSGVMEKFGDLLTGEEVWRFHVVPRPGEEHYPCNAPPWSELIAVSTATGDVAWRTPLGEYPELTAKGILGTGTAVNDGGPIATASGLVFIGSTSDVGFRAFDAGSGTELWRATLDNDALMTPLSYQGGNGKQFVAAVAGGGDGALHIPERSAPPVNATLVAFTLP